jgi:hypothetical protein
VLHEFERAGFVRISYGEIRIIDTAGLESTLSRDA